MTLTDIAVQNLRRRKGRSLFLLLIFLLVIATIVALKVISTNMQQNLQESLNKYGANVIVTPRSESFSLSYGGIAVPGVSYDVKKLNFDVLQVIKANSNDISSIAPEIIGVARGSSTPYLIVGADFNSELQMKPWWKINGRLPGAHELVVGTDIAARDKLNPGSSLVLNGAKYNISGVMQETGGSEDNAVFTDYATASHLTGISNSWSVIDINTDKPDQVVSRLSSLLPQAKVEEVAQLVKGTKEDVDRFASYALFASLLLISIGVLVTVITMVGSVNERTSELGVFRAIGFRRKHIFALLLQEIVIISLTGAFVGYLLGVTIPPLLGPALLQKSIIFQPHWTLGLAALLGSGLGGGAAIAYPAWRAMNLDPADALRYI